MLICMPCHLLVTFCNFLVFLKMLKVVTVKNEVFNRIGVHLLKVVFASLSLVILIENLSFSESVKSLFLPHSLK